MSGGRIRNCGPFHAGISGFQQLVGIVLNPVGDACIGRPAIGRIVLEPSIRGWVVRWRNHDPVAQTVRACVVVRQDRSGDYRRRREPIAALNHDIHTVCRKHFQRGAVRRRGQRVGVLAHEDRAADIRGLAIGANGLRDGQDMRFCE